MKKEIILALLPAKQTAAQTYKIGDTGPAGGIVFYDKGTVSDGWRYLEAAPAEKEFTGVWGTGGFAEGTEGMFKGTKTAIGSGKQNTQLIVAGVKAKDNAAQRCSKLKISKYTDWFLPSKDELDLMYKNLKKKGLGGFKDENCWSSSEDADNSQSNAWAQSFSDGSRFSSPKGRPCRIRAVRAF